LAGVAGCCAPVMAQAMAGPSAPAPRRRHQLDIVLGAGRDRDISGGVDQGRIPLVRVSARPGKSGGAPNASGLRSRPRPGSAYSTSTESHRGQPPARPVASPAVIRVIPPPRSAASMAQLRWQEPADGSDTLAIAQIRWHRTRAPHSAFPRSVYDLAASTILLPDAILDLDLQPEQTIALPMIMVSSASTARARIQHWGGPDGCRCHCRIGL
jgi:hypothetical protein